MSNDGNGNTNRGQKVTPKPWDHRVSLAVDRIYSDIDPESVEVRGLVARCSCGEFEYRFPENAVSDSVAKHIQPHFDTHPLTPLSIAETGGDSIVLVMGVPGPTDAMVHMTISVPKAVYHDGKALGKHLGMIGSPAHFAAEQQRRTFRERAQSEGFHVVDIPMDKASGIHGIADIFSFLDNLRGGTPDETGEPGVAMFDVPKPENMTGFLNEENLTNQNLDDIGPRG